MLKFRIKRNVPGSALVHTVDICGHNKYHFLLSKPKSGVSMVTAFTPAGLHHDFCIEASGAGLNYVTKFRCHYQMDLLRHIPERKILHATHPPTQTLPSLTFALCYCADQVLRTSGWAVLSKSNCHLPPTMTSPSVELCALGGNGHCGFWFTNVASIRVFLGNSVS